ncbi:MAG: C4-type zinc ribbon domain-containing protein [Candidatus Zixiibacteriota bacterium]
MRNDLELLLKLQVIDYDLGELERSKDYLPDMMENLNREIQEAKQKVIDTASALDEARMTRKRLELEIKARESELQKYQQQMMSIKTNREYDALVAEIDNIKAAISNHETDLLKTMDLIDQLDKEGNLWREKEASIIENNQKQLQVLQEKMDSIGDKVSEKKGSRQEIVQSISTGVMATYERVRKGRGGRAVVVVKKKACSSCFKSLTPKKIQEIKRADHVYTCDYCGCLLYWDEEESP